MFGFKKKKQYYGSSDIEKTTTETKQKTPLIAFKVPKSTQKRRRREYRGQSILRDMF